MKHCAAFVPSSVSPEFWMPCTAPVIGRGLLCVVHRDAVDGALLGLHAARVMRPRKTVLAKKRERRTAKAAASSGSSAPRVKSGASLAPRL